MKRKLFLGPKLRRLREGKKLNQAALAALLEVSPSYLNQIENNQRPLTVSVLLRIGAVFGVDLNSLVEDEDARIVADLREALNDPAFGEGKVTLAELRNATAASPDLAKRVMSLYHSYRTLRDRLQSLTETLPHRSSGDDPLPQFPYEAVRDFFYYRDNYFDELDGAAEQLFASEQFSAADLHPHLAEYLKRRHGVRIRIVQEDGNDSMRHYDSANRILSLSALLHPSSRIFQMAHQVALLGFSDVIGAIVEKAGLQTEDARALCRVGLANYFAGALMMPYGPFLRDARAVRHDVELLQSRFGASFEQVCHRLSTLQRPGDRGIPFYFVRIDMAGNITKRHSATRFHFTQFGGACPLWNVHSAFGAPGRILVQHARMPDGIAYLCIARTVTKLGGAYSRPDRHFAVGLGCEVTHASELVYSAGIDLADDQAATPIGVNCRVCERTDCQQRAFPPVGSHVTVEKDNRRFVPYVFE
jgi:predicted transcriptional regulator/DNA-binding XRE family transcriptional regulator